MRFDQQIEDFLRTCGAGNTALAHLERLEFFRTDLEQANRTLNLTRITSREDFWIKHVADSLSLGLALPTVLRQPAAVADIGFGAGFPLLPLAWANPALEITGFEAKQKKALFVREEAVKLGLANVRIVSQQAREAARSQAYAGAFDIVVARAVKDGPYMVRHCRQFLRPSRPSALVLYKTPATVQQELDKTKREAARYELHVHVSQEITLPYKAGTRQFIIIQNGAELPS